MKHEAGFTWIDVGFALLALFLIFGIALPAIIGMCTTYHNPPEDTVEITTMCDKTYYVLEYEILEDGTLLTHSGYTRPMLVFWELDWRLVEKEKSFPKGAYTIQE